MTTLYHGTNDEWLEIGDETDDGFCATDDCSVAGDYGSTVFVVELPSDARIADETALVAAAEAVGLGSLDAYQLFELADRWGVRAQLATDGFDVVCYEDLSAEDDGHTTWRAVRDGAFEVVA